VVYTGQDLTAYANQEASWHFLQPCSCQNTKEVVEYILHHPLWRLSLQTHKLIDIN
jgi:7-carboxy-7-deazaguanine synthase